MFAYVIKRLGRFREGGAKGVAGAKIALRESSHNGQAGMCACFTVFELEVPTFRALTILRLVRSSARSSHLLHKTKHEAPRLPSRVNRHAGSDIAG
jgi:hypothetical protein